MARFRSPGLPGGLCLLFLFLPSTGSAGWWFVPNWRDVLRYAWSVRFILLAALFSGLEIAWPLLDGLLPIPQRTFAVMSGLFVAAAFVARLVAQKKLRDRR